MSKLRVDQISPTDDSITLNVADLGTLSQISNPDGYKLIGEVSSFAQLRTVVPVTAGLKVKLRGWHSGSVEGGGEFVSVAGTVTDDGGIICVPTGAVNLYWKRVDTNPVSVQMYGGKGDGTYINDTAITSAISYLQSNGGGTLHFPKGRYRFNSSINVSSSEASPITLLGDGKVESVLVYGGVSTTIDLVYLENSSHFTLRGLGFKSLTTMTDGNTVHLKYSSFNTIEDISISTQNDYPNFNLYNGIYFDSTDFSTMEDFQIFTKFRGLKVSGDGPGQLTYPQYDLWCSRGKISYCQFGVTIGGGFDNFYIDQTMITYNQVNVIVDSSLSNTPNGVLHFGSQCIIEYSQGGPNVAIDDSNAQSPYSQVTISGHVSWANTDGIAVISYPNSPIVINCPFIGYNQQHGINVADNSSIIDIAESCRINNNQSHGIYAQFPVLSIKLPNLMDNNTNVYNSNITPKVNLKGVSNTNYAVVVPTGSAQGNAALISTEYVLLNTNSDPNAGVILPANWDGKTVRIFNYSQTSVKVYPQGGGGINALGTNNPLTLPTGSSVTLYSTGAIWLS